MTAPKLKWHRLGRNNWRAFCGKDTLNGSGLCLGIFPTLGVICVYPPGLDRSDVMMTDVEKADVTIAMCRAEELATDYAREEFGALLGMVKP